MVITCIFSKAKMHFDHASRVSERATVPTMEVAHICILGVLKKGARHGGPRTTSRLVDANLGYAFVPNALFSLFQIFRGVFTPP